MRKKRERERERERKKSSSVKWIKELKFWFSLVQKGVLIKFRFSFQLLKKAIHHFHYGKSENNVYQQQQPHSNGSSEMPIKAIHHLVQNTNL